MERDIILNFISYNFKILASSMMKQLTIYLYGKDTENNDSLFFDNDKIFVYDVKLPRIYSKKLDFDKLKTGVLDFSGTIENVECFKKEDFNYELIEPSSNKDISKIDFNYVYFYPLIKDSIRVGTILIYTENYIDDFKFTPQSVTSLIKQLINSDYDDLMKQVIENFSYQGFYYVLKRNNQYLIGEELKNTGLNNVDEFINNKVVLHKILEFPYDDVEIYYVDKAAYDKDYTSFYHLDSLDKQELPSKFTFVMCEWTESVKKFNNILNKINSTYKVFVVDSEYYLIIIDGNFKKSEIDNIFSENPTYYMSILSPSKINNKMKLSRITDYIKNSRPEEFDIDNFKEYISHVGSEELNININKKQSLYDKDNNYICDVIGNYLGNVKFDDNLLKYEKKLFSKLDRYIKSDELKEQCYIFVQSSSLGKRKFREIIKKYHTNSVKINLIIHYDGRINKTEFENEIDKLIENNVMIFFTSSIYLSFNLGSLMKKANGLFISNSEAMDIKSHEVMYLNRMIKTVSEGKKLLIEDDNITLNDIEFYIIK